MLPHKETAFRKTWLFLKNHFDTLVPCSQIFPSSSHGLQTDIQIPLSSGVLSSCSLFQVQVTRFPYVKPLWDQNSLPDPPKKFWGFPVAKLGPCGVPSGPPAMTSHVPAILQSAVHMCTYLLEAFLNSSCWKWRRSLRVLTHIVEVL